MKEKTTLLFLLICAFINAQSIDSITFSNGGELQSNGTNIINVTIGEPIVGTITNTETLHQGFWASAYALETLDISKPVELDNSLVIYPNPVTDILNISMRFSRDYVFTIFNIEGKKVFQSSTNGALKNAVNLDILPSGLYLLQIKDPASSYTKSIKFLKQ